MKTTIRSNLFKEISMKSVLAIVLSTLIPIQSAWSSSIGSSTVVSPFQFPLPHALGTISESYQPSGSCKDTPDVIFIQNLHVNRSVQFAISGILNNLKVQGWLPERVAIEGATGPQDTASMQNAADPAIRKVAADYLVNQGEMSGAMHYVITSGQ